MPRSLKGSGKDELWAADCDGNGIINVLDILGIANVILGLDTCQP